jgi:hypothetical protein
MFILHWFSINDHVLYQPNIKSNDNFRKAIKNENMDKKYLCFPTFKEDKLKGVVVQDKNTKEDFHMPKRESQKLITPPIKHVGKGSL